MKPTLKQIWLAAEIAGEDACNAVAVAIVKRAMYSRKCKQEWPLLADEAREMGFSLTCRPHRMEPVGGAVTAMTVHIPPAPFTIINRASDNIHHRTLYGTQGVANAIRRALKQAHGAV